jgi:hypothetical protein
MKISAKHTEFIRLVANGTNQSEAYRATVGNPKATLSSVKSKASQLAKKYADLIDKERDVLKVIVEEAQNNRVAEIAQMNIMTSVERMEFLTKMAKGEVKVKQPFVIGGKIMEYPSEPTFAERRAAIAELNKMDGSYAPTESKVKLDDNRPTTKIKLNDGTEIEL